MSNDLFYNSVSEKSHFRDPFYNMNTSYIIKILSNEEECFNLLRMIRWPDGVVCPRCGSRNVIKWGRYYGGHHYLYKDCGRTFNDRTGTLFHYSRFSLRTWILIIVLII